MNIAKSMFRNLFEPRPLSPTDMMIQWADSSAEPTFRWTLIRLVGLSEFEVKLFKDINSS